MIVISGSGRSGTSFAAECFRNAGVDVGGSFIDSINAGWEHPEVVKVNQDINAIVGFLECRDVIHLPPEIKDEIARLSKPGVLNVVKDPLFSYTLEAWIHLGKVDGVIHMERPISEVVLSAGVIDPDPTMERYMARVGGLTMVCDRHRIERQVIAFPEVLDINTIHAKRLIFQIGLLTGDYERAKESLIKTVRKVEE